MEINNKLKFKSHINKIAKQYQKDINIIKSVAFGKRGGHPEVVLQINKSIIWSRTDCCSFVFGHISQHSLVRLENIQNQALRLAMVHLEQH